MDEPKRPLIGRKKELADLLQLFLRDRAQLVTVTGPEGVGKTRFAEEVVAELNFSVELVDDADVTQLPASPHVLATSPERLGAPGERVYRLRPLAEAPAVELFRQRAAEANPDFNASYEEIAAACVRLGRLPGAIVQAAARGSLD
jgi:predicted ATPase